MPKSKELMILDEKIRKKLSNIRRGGQMTKREEKGRRL